MGQEHSKKEGAIRISQIGQDIRKIWQREVSSLPFSKDLPRLAKNFVMVEREGNEVQAYDRVKYPNTGDLGQNRLGVMDALYRIFIVTARRVEPDVVGLITKDLFDREVNLNHHTSLTGFALNYLGEESKTVVLLKACNQSILAPAITQMKTALMGKLEYRDVQGGWKVVVGLQDSLSVTHIRREQAVVKANNDTGEFLNSFIFEWCLRIDFKPDLSDIHEISLKLSKVDIVDPNTINNATTTAAVSTEDVEALDSNGGNKILCVPKQSSVEDQQLLEQTLRQIFIDVSTTDLIEDPRKRRISTRLGGGGDSPSGSDKDKVGALRRLSMAARRLSVSFKQPTQRRADFGEM